MKLCLTLFLITLVLFCSICPAPASGAELRNIPLEWKPTDTISALDAIDLTVFHNVKFTVNPFSDIRKRPEEIGKNVEKRGTDRILLVTTRDNVAVWLSDRFAKILEEFDIDVVKTGGTFVLDADIVKFFVTEESVYKADVGLKVRLKTPGGTVIWEGMTAGSATRFGSSYKAENYFEGLSNASIAAVHGLLKNEAFKQAVQKNK